MPGSVPLPAPVTTAGATLSTENAGPLRAALLLAGSCLPVLGAVLIAPVLPRMQDHFDSVPGAKTLVPVVLTVPALALALLAPFAGVIVDRLGRKRLLVTATVLYALFGTAPLWLHSLGAIVASRVLVGITEAAIMTCCTTLIGDYYTGHVRDRYLALQTMCASAAATAFFVLGGALGSAGWRAPSGSTPSASCSPRRWPPRCPGRDPATRPPRTNRPSGHGRSPSGGWPGSARSPCSAPRSSTPCRWRCRTSSTTWG